MKSEFSRQIFVKYSSIKFHQNPSSGSRRKDGQQSRQAGRRTERHDETDLTVTFRYITNAPKINVYMKKERVTRNAAWRSTSYYRKLQLYLLLAFNGQGDVMHAHSRYVTAMPCIFKSWPDTRRSCLPTSNIKLHNKNNNFL
jgi:hypothetical protein